MRTAITTKRKKRLKKTVDKLRYFRFMSKRNNSRIISENAKFSLWPMFKFNSKHNQHLNNCTKKALITLPLTSGTPFHSIWNSRTIFLLLIWNNVFTPPWKLLYTTFRHLILWNFTFQTDTIVQSSSKQSIIQISLFINLAAINMWKINMWQVESLAKWLRCIYKSCSFHIYCCFYTCIIHYYTDIERLSYNESWEIKGRMPDRPNSSPFENKLGSFCLSVPASVCFICLPECLFPSVCFCLADTRFR